MNLLKELKSRSIESKIDLSNLSIEELQNVVTYSERLIRTKEREAREYREKYSRENLKIDDIIEVTGNKFKGELFEVIKLNDKKVKCKRENGEIWNIPYAHILMAQSVQFPLNSGGLLNQLPPKELVLLVLNSLKNCKA